MLFPRNLRPRAASRFWIDPACERKSERYAALSTACLFLALAAAVFAPRPEAPTLAVPGGRALSVELRLAPAPDPRPVRPLPESAARKLLSEEPLPDSFVVPEPVQAEQRPEPQPEPEPQPVPPVPQPVPDAPKPAPRLVKTESRPRPKTPKPPQQAAPASDGVETAGSQNAPNITETTAATHATGNAPSAGHGEGADTADKRSAILGALLQAVNQHKKYPKQARRLGLEARVALAVRLNREGRVVAATLCRPSGQGIMDSAARELGSKLIGLEIPQARGLNLEITVPIRYELKDS